MLNIGAVHAQWFTMVILCCIDSLFLAVYGVVRITANQTKKVLSIFSRSLETYCFTTGTGHSRQGLSPGKPGCLATLKYKLFKQSSSRK